MDFTVRSRTCLVCKSVAAIEDVTGRLFDREGHRLPPKEAIEYLRGIGMTGNDRTVRARVDHHAKHVQRSLASPVTVIDPQSLVPVRPEHAPIGWADANQRAIEIGAMFGEMVAAEASDYDPKEKIAAWKTGLLAASKRGDWEAKGARMRQELEVATMLASGVPRGDIPGLVEPPE